MLASTVPRIRHAQPRLLPALESLQLRFMGCGTDDKPKDTQKVGMGPPQMIQDLQAKTEKEVR